MVCSVARDVFEERTAARSLVSVFLLCFGLVLSDIPATPATCCGVVDQTRSSVREVAVLFCFVVFWFLVPIFVLRYKLCRCQASTVWKQ